MGRFLNAVRTLFEPADDPYVRRSEVTRLTAEVAEAETALGSLFDKYNTLAARFRKREQRAEDNAPDVLTLEHRRRLVNRGFLAARGISVPETGARADVNGDQSGAGPGHG